MDEVRTLTRGSNARVTAVSVLVPVLGRPQRVEPLLASLEASSRYIKCVPTFLVSPGDEAEREAVSASGTTAEVVPWPAGPGDFAMKHNHGFRIAVAQGYEWIFLAADDLVFHPGWIERALACHLETHACVIGTNDLANRRVTEGRHSTHTLVHADYLECGTIDEPGKILHENYGHAWCDDELVQTAMYRETWAHATDSIVEHSHPDWGTAEMDDTYAKGKASFEQDRALYQSRKHLWGLR